MFISMTTTSDFNATDWPEAESAPGANDADLGSAAADGEDDTDSGSASSNSGPSGSATAPGRAKAARPAARMNDRTQRALVRRAAEKAVEISGANPHHRTMLAKLLGIDDDDVVAITVAAVGGSTVAVADDLFSLTDADPMEAGIMAAELAADKSRAKALWTLLVSVKAAKGEMPVGSGRAGLAMARAAKGLDKGVREEINSALALLS